MKTLWLFICLFLAMLMFGCATVPSLRVSQPWIRSLKSGESIEPANSVKIDVSGTTLPLLGNEQLVSETLRLQLAQLIRRRGFTVEENNYGYIVKLTYKTDRSDRMKYSSTISSTNTLEYTTSTSSGAGATSGLGVSIARAISALSSRSTTGGTQTAEQILSYTHTISIELSNREGVMSWKGESTWDTKDLNILNGIIPALQLVLSNLPSDKTVRPEVQEIKDTHVKNYYRLECRGVWFTCPALPYRILFSDNSPSNTDIAVPISVINQNAFAAYVDLIQTAEYALPAGDEKDWRNPLQISFWKHVTLGGQYSLGPDKRSINILIELTGKSNGYYIDKCKIADDKEFSDFNNRLQKWREALYNYYDVYKR